MSVEIIFLCDQDDIWVPEKVEIILSEFLATPDSLLAFSNAYIVDENANKLGVTQFQMVRMHKQMMNQLQGKNAFSCLLKRNVVTGATVAFRRQLMDRSSPFVDGWLHDEWLAIMATTYAPLIIVEQALVLYPQYNHNQCGMRPSSLSAKVSEAKINKRQTLNEKRLNHLLSRISRFLGEINNDVT